MLYSVILPTYNERENLPIIYYLIDKSFNDANLKYEVVIVDDSSPDNTLKVAKAIQKSYGKDHVTIVSRKGKLGLGTAYIAGLKAAKGQRIILMDADLSHHPKFIQQMVTVMDETKVDIVTGTRYASGGGVYGWDIKRKLTSKGANFLADFLLNPGVSDLTEIAMMRITQSNAELVGIYDPHYAKNEYFGVEVFREITKMPRFDALILTSMEQTIDLLEQIEQFASQSEINQQQIYVPDMLLNMRYRLPEEN